MTVYIFANMSNNLYFLKIIFGVLGEKRASEKVRRNFDNDFFHPLLTNSNSLDYI